MLTNKLAAAIVASLGLAVGLAPMKAQAATAESDTGTADDFSVLWGVRMFRAKNDDRDEEEWQNNLDFHGAPISRDVIILYQGELGNFPKAGIHLFELDPSLWDSHMRKVRRDVEKRIPEDFTGLVVIDYEEWRPTWNWTKNVRRDQAPFDALDHDFLLDWRDAIRETRRDEYFSHSSDTRLQYVYDTYEQTALRFYLDTLRECKRLRPNAKWAYFNFPRSIYHSPLTPYGAEGYGTGPSEATRINDKIQALFDEQDAVVPSIYPRMWTYQGDPDPNMPADVQNRAEQNAEFIATNIAEAERLGHGKPVYPMISLQYYMPRYSEHPWLNDVNTQQAVQVSHDAGAAGLILWAGIDTDEQWNSLQELVSNRISPAVIECVGGGMKDNSQSGALAQGGAGSGSTGDGAADVGGPAGKHANSGSVTLRKTAKKTSVFSVSGGN